jgi:hypothetical protein
VYEDEINRYLLEMVRRHQTTDPPDGFLLVRLDDVRIAVHPGLFNVTVRVKWGPLPVVYGLTGTPKKVTDAFRMQVHQVRLGLLPVPSLVADRWIIPKIARIFEQLETEKTVLRRVGSLHLETGKIWAHTDAR